MGSVNVRTTTIRKKNPSKPQRKIEARRVVINNQIRRLSASASSKRGK